MMQNKAGWSMQQMRDHRKAREPGPLLTPAFRDKTKMRKGTGISSFARS
jgi:hypothetical protein